MRKFLLGYLIPRILQYLTVCFIGITAVFIIPRLSPLSPVEAQISMITSSGSMVDPAAIERLRAALPEMYGVSGSRCEQ